MPISFVFWLLMLLWLIFGIGWRNYPFQASFPAFGGDLLLFIVIALLGWHAFGFPIRG